MFKIVKKSVVWGGRELSIETGRIARQADGAVIVTYGGTTVLCCVVAEKKPASEEGFFPLNVHYQEKAYAIGRFPGGFSKREGKPSDNEALIARLIDRPLRPLFEKGFHNETQIICTVLSYDKKCSSDIVSLIGASAALAISGIPFNGPVAACKLGYKNGNFLLNSEEKSDLDLIVAGSKGGVLMVESAASELKEEQMIDAIWYCHEQYQCVLDLITEFAKEAGKPRWKVESNSAAYKGLSKKYIDALTKGVKEAYKIKAKAARHEKLDSVYDAVSAKLSDEAEKNLLKELFKDIQRDVMRGEVTSSKKRIDGRGFDDVRDIAIETGWLPIVHGSALFTRGETQAMCVLTLGAAQDEQIVETLAGDYRDSFMLHYNFDPYSVGEVTRLGAVSRREIGHGRLAHKALVPVLPDKSKFPYTIRVVSEISESNGSSSMASVCGATLAMMQGGVPISKHVCGVAMGLIKEKKRFTILTDILGDEDALGDMDFKVAGTVDGITALQMDIKVTDISREIMVEALEKAKKARAVIMSKMIAVQPSVNPISNNAPQIKVIKIAEHSTKDLIGPGGRVIRDITDKTLTKIDVGDGGIVKIFANNGDLMNQALTMIKMIIAGPEVDDIIVGNVVKIINTGAFVKIGENKDGFLHISEISDSHVENISDVLSEGQEVKVRVVNVSRDRIRVTMKGVK